MYRPRPVSVVLATAAGALVLVGVPTPAAAAAGPPPNSMASMGDSITRGFNACGFFVDCSWRSWSTGSSTTLTSQYRRILTINPAIRGHNYNDARSGAKAV